MRYTSRWSNEYSMVLLEGAFVHRVHLARLSSAVSPALTTELRDLSGPSEDDGTCADVVANFVIADATGRPPVKVAQRRALSGNTKTIR